MKLKLIFSPFGLTVPRWKINRISRCFFLYKQQHLSRSVVWRYAVVLTFIEHAITRARASITFMSMLLRSTL